MHSEGKERVRSASGVDTAAAMIEGAATGLAAQQVTAAAMIEGAATGLAAQQVTPALP